MITVVHDEIIYKVNFIWGIGIFTQVKHDRYTALFQFGQSALFHTSELRRTRSALVPRKFSAWIPIAFTWRQDSLLVWFVRLVKWCNWKINVGSSCHSVLGSPQQPIETNRCVCDLIEKEDTVDYCRNSEAIRIFFRMLIFKRWLDK